MAQVIRRLISLVISLVISLGAGIAPALAFEGVDYTLTKIGRAHV